MSVEWTPPTPRSGWRGQWDRFIGPGATSAENALIIGASVAGVAFALLFPAVVGAEWTALQLIVAAVIAFDIVGGVPANATSAAKRWYHRPGQGFRHHVTFVAVHAVHLLAVAWLFRDGDWIYFAVTYGYLLLATVVILRAPAYLQRPLALTLYLGGLAVALVMLGPTEGLTWFLPVFYLKLLVAHIVTEAPLASESRKDG